MNARWGNLQAILAGDFLLARASEIAASLGTEVAGLLARTIGRLCEGQVDELRHTYDSARTEASYLASISGKTASLFATAAASAASSPASTASLIDALTDFGEAYGMVFQIVDDVLDVTATDDQLGKPAGHDLVEGVYTLPVHAHAAGRRRAGDGAAGAARQAARHGRAREGAGDRPPERRRRIRLRHRASLGGTRRSRMQRLARLVGNRRPPRRSGESRRVARLISLGHEH